MRRDSIFYQLFRQYPSLLFELTDRPPDRFSTIIVYKFSELSRMSSNTDFVEYICEQIDGAGIVVAKKMFGEYAIYCNDKIVALVCDDRLYIKPTSAGKSAIESPVEAPPYPGAKPYFLIEDRIDDREWLTELIRSTANELPAPKPKQPKSTQRKNKSK